eukprot:2814239-Amphidinium_carterae.1
MCMGAVDWSHLALFATPGSCHFGTSHRAMQRDACGPLCFVRLRLKGLGCMHHRRFGKSSAGDAH